MFYFTSWEDDSIVKGATPYSSTHSDSSEFVEQILDEHYPNLQYTFLFGNRLEKYAVESIDSSRNEDGKVINNILFKSVACSAKDMSRINTLIGESRSILGKVLDYCKEKDDFELRAGIILILMMLILDFRY